MTGSNGGKKTAQATEYVVLEMVEMRVEDEHEAVGHAWAPVLNQTAAEGPDLQPRIFTAPSRDAAIRQHTGDGPDLIEGSWKAVPVSSWRGGQTTKRVTAAERLPLGGI